MTSNDPLISTLCDPHESIHPIVSTGNTLLIIFQSDLINHKLRFEARYTTAVVRNGSSEGTYEVNRSSKSAPHHYQLSKNYSLILITLSINFSCLFLIEQQSVQWLVWV